MGKILKRLVSKLFIVSFIILLQMLWFFYLFYAASVANHIFDMLMKIAAICMALYIANRQMKVYIRLSWIFLILSLPIVGIPCYFFFGRPELTSRTQHRMKAIIDAHSEYRPANADVDEKLKDIDLEAFRQTRLIEQNMHYPLYMEDSSIYYKTAEEAFDDMLKDLESAKEFIFMEYFIIGPGIMLDKILDIMKQKVKEGVEVRIIYDDFGSINVIPRGFAKQLQKDGIKVCRFNPYKPVLSVVMNDRDHRKILVIDGKIAHTGGYNIADEYINEIERFGHWKDAGIRITGDSVNSFTTMFLELWSYINRCDDIEKEYLRPYNETLSGDAFIMPFCDSPLDHDNVGENIFVNVISRAKKYVYIFTPYLILSTELSHALITAALSGVDVRIVTPKIPDKKTIYLQTKANFRQLLLVGVRIYKYTPGFIHSKCIVSDDTTAIVSTCNFDFRSIYWNFEDFVYLYNSKTVMDVKDDALETFEISEEVSLEECERQSFMTRLVQSILQLFAPLL